MGFSDDVLIAFGKIPTNYDIDKDLFADSLLVLKIGVLLCNYYTNIY